MSLFSVYAFARNRRGGEEVRGGVIEGGRRKEGEDQLVIQPEETGSRCKAVSW